MKYVLCTTTLLWPGFGILIRTLIDMLIYDLRCLHVINFSFIHVSHSMISELLHVVKQISAMIA